MPPYHVRAATLDDLDTLVSHRLKMFIEMGTSLDPVVVGGAFRRWVMDEMPAGTYRHWVVETDAGAIVAGGGMTVLPWPPGPQYVGGRIAFVYNVYTEPAWRHKGLAGTIMDTIHAWCRDHGVGVVALNASAAGQPVYESMGYRVSPSPMMMAAVGP